MTKNNRTKRGISILGILILGAVIVLALSYFKVSIRAVVDSPTGQENISYVEGSTKSLWTAYLAEPASYLWNDVWVKIFWRPFISNIEKINAGQPTEMDNAANNLKVNQ